MKIKQNTIHTNLLREPKWNIVLNEERGSSECIKMYSDENLKITGNIFLNSRLYMDKQILYLDPSDENQQPNNSKSPLVVWFDRNQIECNDGVFEANIIARNLENSSKVFDPVTSKNDTNNPRYLEGDLPWERYYGNYLSIEMRDSKPEHNSDLTMLIRVIHKIEDNNIDKFKDISKLFSYYDRYFP